MFFTIQQYLFSTKFSDRTLYIEGSGGIVVFAGSIFVQITTVSRQQLFCR